MNITIASLFLLSSTQNSPYISLPLLYSQSQSIFSVRSSYFKNFINTFMKIISPNAVDSEGSFRVFHNQHFSIESSQFKNFLSPAVFVNSIPDGSVNCMRLRYFQVNKTVVLNQSGICGLVHRNTFNNFYCTPSVFFVNATDYKLYIDRNNFTQCTLCLYIINGSVNVQNSFFTNCSATTQVSKSEMSDQIYQNYSVAVLMNSAFNEITDCNASNCAPSAIYMCLSSGDILNVLVEFSHETPPADSFFVCIERCALVRIENSIFSYRRQSDNKQSLISNSEAGGLLIKNSQNVDLFYLFFYEFPSFSISLQDYSYITMNYLCFMKNEESSIQVDDTSSFLIIEPEHVVFNEGCHFTPEPTTQLTKSDRNYGIIALVVFTVFFFCVFVAFIACIFKKKRPADEVYSALHQEDFSTEDTSRAISD